MNHLRYSDAEMFRRGGACPRSRRLWVRRLRVAALAVLVLGSGACEKKAPPDVLATVGPNEIRSGQFLERLKQRGGTNPAGVNREALLQEMIDAEALYLKALEAGLNNDPEIERSYRNLLIGAYREQTLRKRLEKLDVSDAEIEAAYAAAQTRFTRPERLKLAVLARRVPGLPNSSERQEVRVQLESARQHALVPEFSTNAGFGSLAVTNSDDQASRYRGGDIGWVGPGRPHPQWSETVVSAGAALTNHGDISPVVEDRAGLYVVKLMERQPAAPQPLAEVKEHLRQQLRNQKRQKVEREFMEEIRASMAIKVFPEKLAQLPTIDSNANDTATPRPRP